MTGNRIRITGARITPVAFADPPLLNTVGVHQPFALRAIVEVDTDAGLVGLGETYADTAHLGGCTAAADAIVGLDVFALNAIRAAISDRLGGTRCGTRRSGLAGMITSASTVDRVFSPFEVACLDVQGQAAGRPVSDLLGGAVRDAVPFSAYLFYKWAAHPGGEPDDWGEALDPDAIVAQARRMIDEYGFTAIKLKGGVFPPEEEMAAIEALRGRVPGPSAAARPERRVDAADVDQGGVGSGRGARVPRGPHARPGRHGRGRAAGADAVGHQHVRGGVRSACARCGQAVCRSGAFRPPLLGRSAAIAAAGRHLRELRSRPVDALQLAPRHQPRRHGAPGRRRRRTSPTRATPTGRGRPRRSSSRARSSSSTGRCRCRRRRGWACRSTRTASPRCTSSTCAAASATATTPVTCAASTRTTRRSARAGRPSAATLMH